MINDVKGRDCMNMISFNVNNGGKIELTQREHDGSVMFTVGASKIEAWIKKPFDVWKQEFTGEYMGMDVDSWENLGGVLK